MNAQVSSLCTGHGRCYVLHGEVYGRTSSATTCTVRASSRWRQGSRTPNEAVCGVPGAGDFDRRELMPAMASLC